MYEQAPPISNLHSTIETMVSSAIIPNLKYNESEKIASADIGLPIRSKQLRIHSHICYGMIGNIIDKTPPGIAGIQSLYLLHPTEKTIVARIGIYETAPTGKQYLRLFSFATDEYIKPYQIARFQDKNVTPLDKSSTLPQDKSTLDKKIRKKAESEYADLFAPAPVSLSRPPLSSTPVPYTIIPGFVLPPALPEETPEIAKTLRDEFIPSSTHPWIATFMQNAHYRTRENEGGGDCFFASIRDALHEIGRSLSVAQMRQLVAEHMTPDSFHVQKQMHADMVQEYNNLTQEIKQCQQQAAKLNAFKVEQHKLAHETHTEISPATISKYETEVAQLTKRFEQTKKDLFTVRRHLSQSDSQAMGYIQTMDQFRAHIQTPAYWADEVAVLILEKALQLKFIILSEQNFQQGFVDGVLVCTPNPTEQAEFHPKYYIPLSYNGTHYRQILYTGRGIFSFSEIPLDLKTLILNKCVENPRNGFAVIPEWKRRLLLTGRGPARDVEREAAVTTDIQFVYHIQAANMLPGQGAGECIPPEIGTMFRALAKYTHWRRMLDDAYPCTFQLGALEWPSITHYLTAFPYKDEYPAFYQSFALPTGRNAGLSAEQLAATMEANAARLPVCKPVSAVTMEGVREMALTTKFIQNPTFAWVLMLTRNAQLSRFRRKQPPEVDSILMKVRGSLLKQAIQKERTERTA